jgi:hypothetical protein
VRMDSIDKFGRYSIDLFEPRSCVKEARKEFQLVLVECDDRQSTS